MIRPAVASFSLSLQRSGAKAVSGFDTSTELPAILARDLASPVAQMEITTCHRNGSKKATNRFVFWYVFSMFQFQLILIVKLLNDK